MLRLLRVLLGGLVLVGLLAAAVRAEEAKPKPPKEEDDYELQKLLIDTLDEIQRNYVKDVSRRELVEAAIQGILSKLDPYSSYISPKEMDEFRTSVESEFGGIGIQITMDGGELKVLSPVAGTPAYRAGVLAGDHILQINGKSTDGLTLDQAVQMLKGDEGSQVTLTVSHPGRGKTEKISITREKIHVETVLGDRRKPDDTWDFMLDHEKRIGYVRITGFSRDTATDLKSALEELKKDGMRGLVLDLRFNPGGLLTSAIDVSDLFIAEGRIVSTKGRNTPERVWNAHKEGTFEGFPMAVLVNRFSASASEIVAACLQDHGRAKIVGERSWGKGSVQNVIELDDRHSALKLTTSAYRRPSGKNIHRFPGAGEDEEWGVTPDKGFALKLTDGEMVALIENRRDRDIVQPKPAGEPKPEASKAEGPSDGGDSASGATSAAPDAGGSKPAGRIEGTIEAPLPAEPAGGPAAEARFVDKQLQMAVDYVIGALKK